MGHGMVASLAIDGRSRSDVFVEKGRSWVPSCAEMRKQVLCRHGKRLREMEKLWHFSPEDCAVSTTAGQSRLRNASGKLHIDRMHGAL